MKSILEQDFPEVARNIALQDDVRVKFEKQKSKMLEYFKDKDHIDSHEELCVIISTLESNSVELRNQKTKDFFKNFFGWQDDKNGNEIRLLIDLMKQDEAINSLTYAVTKKTILGDDKVKFSSRFVFEI